VCSRHNRPTTDLSPAVPRAVASSPGLCGHLSFNSAAERSELLTLLNSRLSSIF